MNNIKNLFKRPHINSNLGKCKEVHRENIKYVDAEDIKQSDNNYTVPVKKDPRTGLLFTPEQENIIPDKELNEYSQNPIANSAVTKATQKINERVNGISNRLANIPDAFTYDSLRHFLENVYYESDPGTNSTYITKMVRSTGVEVNANELVVGTNVFIKGLGPDYWLVTKTISPMFASNADPYLVKLSFFDQTGEDNITSVTTDDIDEYFKN